MIEFLLGLIKPFLDLFNNLIDLLAMRFKLHRTEREKAFFAFKTTLANDIQQLENTELTLNALILNLYPRHEKILQNLEQLYPSRKVKKLISLWPPYQKEYDFLKQLGEFAIAACVLPHPDFGQSPEMIEAVENKRRKEVLKVLCQVRDLL